MCTWCPVPHCCHWKLRAQTWLDMVFWCPPETLKGLWDTHMGLIDITLNLQESHALLERQLDAGWGLGASQAALVTCVWVVNQALISAVNGSLESSYIHLKADAYSYVGLQSGIWNLDVFICSSCLTHHDQWRSCLDKSMEPGKQFSSHKKYLPAFGQVNCSVNSSDGINWFFILSDSNRGQHKHTHALLRPLNMSVWLWIPPTVHWNKVIVFEPFIWN